MSKSYFYYELNRSILKLKNIFNNIYYNDKLRSFGQQIQLFLSIPYKDHVGLPSLPFQINQAVGKSYLYRKLVNQTPTNQRLIIINPRGGWYIGIIQSIIALRLRLKGYQPIFFLCQDLPVCNNRNVSQKPYRNICKNCLSTSRQIAKAFNIAAVTTNDLIGSKIRLHAKKLISQITLKNIDSFTYQGFPFGEFIRVSASSYFFRGTPEKTNKSLKTLKDFIYGLIILYHAYEKLFQNLNKDDLVLICNGRFFWYRLAYEMAKKKGLKIVTFEDFGSTGGTGQKWMFSHHRPIAHLDLSRSWKKWKSIPLTHEESKYLKNNFILPGPDNPTYYPFVKKNWRSISSLLKLNMNQSFDTLYTNLTWDSSAIDKNTIYKNMIDWVINTIKIYQQSKKILLIRVHPVEAKLVNHQKVIDEINKFFTKLPSNIKIIPPTSPVSSYALLKKSNLNFIYTSTIGLEAAVRGINVIVAGDAPYRNKSFTTDVKSISQYKQLINKNKLKSLTKNQIQLAKRFAFLYFYRTRIPLNLYQAKNFSVTGLKFSSLDKLLPGNHPYLDWVINTIIQNNDWAMPRSLTNPLID